MKQKTLRFAILALLASALATTATADPPPQSNDIHDLSHGNYHQDYKLKRQIVVGPTNYVEGYDHSTTSFIQITATVSADISTNGWTITVLKGGTLTIKAGASLTIEGGTGIYDGYFDGPTGGTLINGGGEVIVEQGGKLILAGTSVVTNDSLFTVEAGGSVTVEAGATLTNNKVINLTAGAVFTNRSGNVTSPGMIVAANNDAIDLQNPLKSGFIKRRNEDQTAWDIEVYGNSAGSSVWSEWHTKYLDGKEESGAGVGFSAATLRILSGATLAIPQNITLNVGGSADNPNLLLDVQGALAVRNGGAVIVNSSKVFATTEPANANAHAYLHGTGATLTIDRGGEFTVSAGNNLLAQTGTVINNSGTLTLNGSSSSADNRFSYIYGGLSVKGAAGKVVVNGATLSITSEQAQGALNVDAGGLVQVTGGGTLTISNTATHVTNNGKIEVTDNGTFNNKTYSFFGTGLVEVSGSGKQGTDANWLSPNTHVVVNTTTGNSNSKTITVYGINTWTSALQAYIPSVDTLKLATAAARLLIDNAPLTVSAGKTLTINGAGSISVSAPGKIENGGLITLNAFPLANITGWTPDGFVQTTAGTGSNAKTVITAYGKTAWSATLQGAFSYNTTPAIDTLYIPPGAELDFSNSTGLTIETGKVLRNDGTLKGGTKPLNVAGMLQKGKASSTTGNILGNGTINTELNPDWVSFPTVFNAKTQWGFVVANGTDTLLPTTHYTVSSGAGTATIAGVPAPAPSPSSPPTTAQYGYYGTFTRGYKAVTEVRLSETALPLLVGETFILTDTVYPKVYTEAGKDSVNQHVTWESDHPEFATVDNNGKVTPVAPGTATIKVTTVGINASRQRVEAQCVVNVTLPVTGVKISAGRDTIVGLDTTKLIVAVSPEGASEEVKVESGDPALVAVEAVSGQNYKWQARVKERVKKDTTVYIIATSTDNTEKKDSVGIHLNYIRVSGVTINNKANLEKDSLQKGDSLKLSATVAPDNAAYDNVTWTSLNTGIATVDSTGKVKGIAKGTAKIVVTPADGAQPDTVNIKVYEVPVTRIAIADKEKIEADSLQVRKTWTLTIVTEPENANATGYSWRHVNPDIATVDGNGVVTAVSPGQAKIAVFYTGNTALRDTITIKVYTVGVTGVQINYGASEAPLNIRETLQLDAAVEPANATNRSVTWESDDEAIATVDTSGKVTGVSAGETYIYATTTEGGYKANIKVTVYKVDVQSVKIDSKPASDALQIGYTQQLKATLTPANASDTAVIWESGDEAVATVDAAGVVTGIAAGTTTITLTSHDGNKKDTFTLTVYAVPVSSVTIAGKAAIEADSLGRGTTLQLSATVAPANANNTAITWSSGNEAVATVSEDGTVTALTKGTAFIYVTTADGGKKDSVAIKVYTIPVRSVELTAGADSLAPGATLQLTATIKPEDVNEAYETDYTSCAPGVASVAQDGKVTAIAVGEATIYVTVRSEGAEYKDSVTLKVYTIPVSGVTIAAGPHTLAAGTTLQLSATVSPANATDKRITWSSGDISIATVDAAGLVAGISAGETYIYVTAVASGLKDSVTVTVYQIHVESVTIDGAVEIIDLYTGDRLGLTATITPANATDKAVTWTSGDAGIAAVDAAGVVTAISAGKTFIYVTTVDGEYKDSVAIEVHAVPVEGVTIEGEALALPVGATQELTATVAPANATDKAVTWRSGDTAVATVDEGGLVTGVAAGTAYIYVTTVDGEYRDSVAIEVHAVPVEGVTIEGEALALPVGATQELNATVTPANATEKTVIWRSGNEEVATVTEAGAVTAVAAGEATIYVTTVNGGYKDSVALTVYTIPVEGVTIEGEALALPAGATLELTATVTPENATNTAVIWRSGNEEVATVTEAGVVTAVAAGEATITVTTVDGGLTDSVALTVYTVPVPVEGVTIADATDSLAKDSTLQLTAVILPEGANVDYEVAWESGDSAVAIVDETGLVTGVADGAATIYVTVTTEDSIAYTDSVTIAVYTEEPVIVVPKITGVEIQSDSTWTNIVTFLPEYNKETVYGTLQLTAVVTIEPADSTVDYTLAWESSNTDVATVSETGLVTAVAEGEATITLTVTPADGEPLTTTLNIAIKTVGIAPVPVSSVKAYIADNTLYVNSAVAEKVDIYTISGKLVYSAVKPAGEVQIPLTELTDGVLIIRGASGWVQKAVK